MVTVAPKVEEDVVEESGRVPVTLGVETVTVGFGEADVMVKVLSEACVVCVVTVGSEVVINEGFSDVVSDWRGDVRVVFGSKVVSSSDVARVELGLVPVVLVSGAELVVSVVIVVVAVGVPV